MCRHSILTPGSTGAQKRRQELSTAVSPHDNQFGDGFMHVDGQNLPPHEDAPGRASKSYLTPSDKIFFSLDQGPLEGGYLQSSEVAADIDWTLQDVDLTLFDNLFEGQGIWA